MARSLHTLVLSYILLASAAVQSSALSEYVYDLVERRDGAGFLCPFWEVTEFGLVPKTRDSEDYPQRGSKLSGGPDVEDLPADMRVDLAAVCELLGDVGDVGDNVRKVLPSVTPRTAHSDRMADVGGGDADKQSAISAAVMPSMRIEDANFSPTGADEDLPAAEGFDAFPTSLLAHAILPSAIVGRSYVPVEARKRRFKHSDYATVAQRCERKGTTLRDELTSLLKALPSDAKYGQPLGDSMRDLEPSSMLRLDVQAMHNLHFVHTPAVE